MTMMAAVSSAQSAHGGHEGGEGAESGRGAVGWRVVVSGSPAQSSDVAMAGPFGPKDQQSLTDISCQMAGADGGSGRQPAHIPWSW